MRKDKLTQGDIRKTLIALAIPIMGSSFLQMAYGMVDMLWIGRLGSEAVAAIGTSAIFIAMGFGINSMIITGSGIKLSHAIGARDFHLTNRYIRNGFILNITISIIYILLLIGFRGQLIGFFKLNNPALEAMANTYLIVGGISLFFKFLNFQFVRVLNSFGESKLPFKINTVGVVLNIVLDPLLIFTFHMGVLGAALATVVSQALVTIIFMKHSKKFFVLKKYFKYDFKVMKEILLLGLPLGIQRFLFSIISIVIARIVAQWGAPAIAAQRIGVQVESLSFMTIGGLYGAISSFIGQNYGAEKYIRIRKGYVTAMKLSLFIGLLTTLLFTIFSKQIILIFVNDPKTVEAGVYYLRIVGASQLFMCFEIMTNGSFSGVGKPKVSSTISIICTSLRIPLALYLSQESMFGLNGVWMSISITTVFKGLITPGLFIQELKRIKAKFRKEIKI